MSQVEESLKLSSEEFKDKYQRDKPALETEVIFSCKLGGRAAKGANTAVSLGFLK